MTDHEFWLVLWWCLCTEVAHDPADLAERCPDHDRAVSIGPRVLMRRLPDAGVELGRQAMPPDLQNDPKWMSRPIDERHAR